MAPELEAPLPRDFRAAHKIKRPDRPRSGLHFLRSRVTRLIRRHGVIKLLDCPRQPPPRRMHIRRSHSRRRPACNVHQFYFTYALLAESRQKRVAKVIQAEIRNRLPLTISVFEGQPVLFPIRPEFARATGRPSRASRQIPTSRLRKWPGRRVVPGRMTSRFRRSAGLQCASLRPRRFQPTT